MEVHHHPHVEKKSFKEYLLEGLMIFVAVMMGFIAENIREGIGDDEKGEEFATALVQNLKDDTAFISNAIFENQLKLNGLKELMALAGKDLSLPQNRKSMYEHSGRFIGFYSVFKSNDATLQQLKNSGSMRFIKKAHAADSIANYDVQMQAVYAAGNIYTNAVNTGISASHELLDYSVYYDSSFYTNGKFTEKTLPLLSIDPARQKYFFNKVDFEIGATQNYLNNLAQRKPYAINLLNFLRKEYHLEKE